MPQFLILHLRNPIFIDILLIHTQVNVKELGYSSIPIPLLNWHVLEFIKKLIINYLRKIKDATLLTEWE
ncbi:MAG: hypothetical protein AAF806_10465 [Bacteroidota bacterium]